MDRRGITRFFRFCCLVVVVVVVFVVVVVVVVDLCRLFSAPVH